HGVVKKAVEIVRGFITPYRDVEAHRATAREIDEEVQIEIPRISAELRALQFAHRGCASRSMAAGKRKARRARARLRAHTASHARGVNERRRLSASLPPAARPYAGRFPPSHESLRSAARAARAHRQLPLATSLLRANSLPALPG